jgi:hypothetical protein
MLCTVCLRIKWSIKVYAIWSIIKEIDVSNSSQSLVNMIFLFFAPGCRILNKFESWYVCHHSAKILILFNFSKMPPFHQLQKKRQQPFRI